ncbi:MAG: hypothetical protein H8E74_00915 [Gammaproteobacteria bacterium]|nr:hypothetical protein [Gammaproteobacteria bacterium]
MNEHRDAYRLVPYRALLRNAACSGNLELVQWLTQPDRGLRLDQHTLYNAALSGNHTVVEWLEQRIAEAQQPAGVVNAMQP